MFHICYCFRAEIFHIVRYIGFVFEIWLYWKQWKAKHACIIISCRKSWLNYKISNNKVYYLKVLFICSSVQLYDNPTFCRREVNMLDIVLFTLQISYYFVTWVINLIVNHMCSYKDLLSVLWKFLKICYWWSPLVSKCACF